MSIRRLRTSVKTQVRAEASRGVEHRRLAPYHQEHVLQQILGVGRRHTTATQVTVDTRRQQFKQAAKCKPVRVFSDPHQQRRLLVPLHRHAINRHTFLSGGERQDCGVFGWLSFDHGEIHHAGLYADRLRPDQAVRQ